ncbi:CaiB/BaiF CoA transferase family protein [Palleronia pelagia]|uniref:Formyl-CoA transferase n=1 Tax=Palleronia pelagia TaxID=387096 RepID=A0A1H8INS5_9RHOB|nr:CoA transferase [Palleronia pelagia]SEN69961.1 formyl-CoA transferase [Palleronia pelagia]
MTDASDPMPGALEGVTVLDLTRILAGPTCTQLLGDLGAKVIKIENPAGGDDTRTWGPPYVAPRDGGNSDLAAYFMCANRNKYSVIADLRSPEDQARVRDLAARADVVVENFRPGGLARYGLDADTLCAAHPGLVYCSVTGFGQTGPNRDKPGYDIMAQGYGGMMSLTGAPDGPPMKVGVGITDVMCGMYACVGILAALRHRDRTGQGQRIDLSLVDSQMAWTINEGVNYLTSGEVPKRRGNAHPNIMPYGVYETADGHVIVAVGNNAQFARFAGWLGHGDLPGDPRFATNPARLENRDALDAVLVPALRGRATVEVIAGMEEIGVTVGPVQDLAAAFGSDQAQARGMTVEMAHPATAPGQVRLIGNPLKMSATPVTYRRPPPRLGADTDEILGG